MYAQGCGRRTSMRLECSSATNSYPAGSKSGQPATMRRSLAKHSVRQLTKLAVSLWTMTLRFLVILKFRSSATWQTFHIKPESLYQAYLQWQFNKDVTPRVTFLR